MSNFPSSDQPQDPFGPDPARETPPPAPHPEERAPSRSPWLVGAVLIVLGLVFLLQNFGLRTFDNWWALFILIPAAGSFISAWSMYQSSGQQLTPQVRGSLIGGLILTLVAAAFLFNLNWGMIWPVFLIIIGIGALASGFMR